MKNIKTRVLIACAVCFAVVASLPVNAQTAQEGKNLGALSRENLDKKRPKAPVDLTGTYKFDFNANGGPFIAYVFLPVPKLTPAAIGEMDKLLDYGKKGQDYRDDPGACWPLGVPRIMTRYWPLNIVQLPTMVVITSMFFNSVRWVYMDGRSHPSAEDLVYSYNGHSIGHWEGSTLVVDTVGMESDHHWIQEGVPASDQLHVIERFSKTKEGFKYDLAMTDPVNWVGEWKSTKFYTRDDHADIEEHVCIYEQVSKFPTFKNNIRE